MPPWVAVTHRTRYRYARPVGLSPQLVRLHPCAHARTPLRGFSLRVEPDAATRRCGDPYGNVETRVAPAGPTVSFEAVVAFAADLEPLNPFDFLVEPSAAFWPFAYEPAQAAGLAPYRSAAPAGPGLSALLDDLPRGPGPTIDRLVALNRLVCGRIRYASRLEAGVREPEETLALGEGSCRDSAWLMVRLLRHLGLAARFTSGYLIQLRPERPGPDGRYSPERDGVDLHAWTEAFLPGAGWVGLDATSGLLAAEGHIPLAGAPTPAEAAPISGRTEPVKTGFEVEMSVARLEAAAA